MNLPISIVPQSGICHSGRRLRLAAIGALTALISMVATPVSAGPYSAIHFFGDSLTDSGNAFATVNLPQPPYFDGRITNGFNYADRLAQRLGLDATASLLGGNNYAFATATASVPSPDPVPISLIVQRTQYLAAVGLPDPQALHVIWIGSNDVQNALLATAGGFPLVAAAIFNSAVNSVVETVSILAGAGARNFLVADVPLLGLVPAIAQSGDPALIAQANGATLLFNNAVGTGLAALSAQFGSARIDRLETNSLFLQAVSLPASFGFTNVTQACFTGSPLVPGQGSVCANPDEYLFWDDLHPTARTHQLLADLAYATVVPLPTPALLLGAGLLVIGIIARRKPAQA